jgi:hypothetical protein
MDSHNNTISNNVEQIKDNFYKHYKEIEKSISKYNFDTGALGTFAARIAKENGFSEYVAETCINY